MIFPVAETLKVFFALEWVLTFGITILLHITLLVARTGEALLEPFGLIGQQKYSFF